MVNRSTPNLVFWTVAQTGKVTPLVSGPPGCGKSRSVEAFPVVFDFLRPNVPSRRQDVAVLSNLIGGGRFAKTRYVLVLARVLLARHARNVLANRAMSSSVSSR